MSKFNKIDPQISKLNLFILTNTLLFRNPSFSDKIIARILDATSERPIYPINKKDLMGLFL